MRECINPQEMACLALRYLASGETFRLPKFQFRIGKKTISPIVIDVCQAILEILGPCFVITPRNTSKWLEIANKFYQRWDFPNNIGAIDWKHIVMEQPFNSGSHDRNYKVMDSIILLAMMGPKY